MSTPHPETRHASPAETTAEFDTSSVTIDTGSVDADTKPVDADTGEATDTDPVPIAPFDAPDTSARFGDDATRLPNTADGENRRVG